MAYLKRGNIIRTVQVDVEPGKEADFLNWYINEHEPLLRKIDGVIETYRGINISEQGQKYFYLYVHRDERVQLLPDYIASSKTDWAKKVRPSLRNFEVGNFRLIIDDRLVTQVNGESIISMHQFELKAADVESFAIWFKENHSRTGSEMSKIRALWLCENLDKQKEQFGVICFVADDSYLKLPIQFAPAYAAIISHGAYRIDI